jgi:hypothetical protein
MNPELVNFTISGRSTTGLERASIEHLEEEDSQCSRTESCWKFTFLGKKLQTAFTSTSKKYHKQKNKRQGRELPREGWVAPTIYVTKNGAVSVIIGDIKACHEQLQCTQTTDVTTWSYLILPKNVYWCSIVTLFIVLELLSNSWTERIPEERKQMKIVRGQLQ